MLTLTLQRYIKFTIFATFFYENKQESILNGFTQREFDELQQAITMVISEIGRKLIIICFPPDLH